MFIVVHVSGQLTGDNFCHFLLVECLYCLFNFLLNCSAEGSGCVVKTFSPFRDTNSCVSSPSLIQSTHCVLLFVELFKVLQRVET